MAHDFQWAGLQVESLVREFGGLRALDGASLSLHPGEMLGLVGPNGSGKTTLINVVSGVYPPTSGRILLHGQPVGGLPPHRLAELGINRTFQVPHPFRDLTVEENVRVAWRHGGARRTSVDEILAFVDLEHHRQRPAGSLNVSEQKLLDLARAMATSPSLIMVDELGAGLSQVQLEAVARKLRELADRGVSLLVVEHLMGFLRRITDQVLVMNAGQVIFSGDLQLALKEPEVVRVFLGA